MSLRLFYPSDLVKVDPVPPTIFALSSGADVKYSQVNGCLHPKLMLALPQGGANQASILLEELDLDCLNGTHESVSTTLLGDMADVVVHQAGMKPIAQPSTYTIGWQKVHMAASQGQPGVASPQGTSQFYTMAISTNWNNHLLVWYFSSNRIDELNRITKTTVRFGRAQAEPLYPIAIGDASH